MNRSDLSVRNNALGGTIAGVLLLALGKLSGTFPWVWRALNGSLRHIWGVFNARYSITLPAWVWLVVWMGVATAISRAMVRRAGVRPLATDAIKPKWPELDSLQLAIMRLFVEQDGGQFAIGEIAMRIQVPQLRANKAVEQLEGFGLIGTELNVLDGATVRLTRNGRDFLLASGMVR